MTNLIKISPDAEHRACVTKAAACLLSHQEASSHPDYAASVCSLAESVIKALCKLYKADEVEQASALLSVLEQQVGEALAALPDSWRTHPTFVQLVQAAFSLLKAGLKHAPNNADVLRGIRRTLAALPPSGDVDGVQLGGIADETATWLMRVVLHSRFLPIVAERCTLPIVLPWCREINLPISSIMPLVGNEDDVKALRHIAENALKTEWLTLVDTLLDMLMAYPASVACATDLQEQLEALAPVLLSSYSATMSPSDRATWSLLMSIDQYLHSLAPCSGPEDHPYGVSCMTHGILQRHGYGEDVLTLHVHHYIYPRRFGAEHLEPARIAVTIANFPDEWRMLGTTLQVAKVALITTQLHQVHPKQAL